jgi:hypothetical protein
MRCRCLGRRGTGDRGFDQNIVRPADHDQMFDIVAPHQHELALSVEVEDIDDGESRLAPATVWHIEPLAAQNPAQHGDEQHDDGECDDRQQKQDELAVAEKITEDRHAGRAPFWNCRTDEIHCSTPCVQLSHKVNEWLICSRPNCHRRAMRFW